MPPLRTLKGILLCAALALPAKAESAFSSLTPLPDGYFGHSLAAAHGFLYHCGGLSSSNGIGDGDKVYYAKILAPGKIGPWLQGPALPEPAFFHAGAAWNRTLYVLGGYHFRDGFTVSGSVYYSNLNEDGSPGPWHATASLPEGLFLHSAAVWNGTLYLTGGWSDGGLLNSVYSAAIREDGSLGPWTPQTPLPQGVYAHTTVQDGTIYVIGGAIQNGTQIHNGVYFSKIKADRNLSEWQSGTPLPEAIANHISAVIGGRVYVAGGWTGAQPTDAVRTAPILADKSLGDWREESPLPVKLYYHAGASADGVLYLSGGNDTNQPVSAVYSFVAPAPPPPPPIADRLPPRTNLEVGTPLLASAPPIISPETLLSLSAQDDRDTVGDGLGLGVQSSQFSIDGAAFAEYASPLSIESDGAHELRYFSVDKAANSEPVKAWAFQVDATAPQTTLQVGSPVISLFGIDLISTKTPLTLSAVDPVVNGTASGVDIIRYSLDDGTETTYAGPFSLPEGWHTLSFGATDRIGHREGRQTATLLAGSLLEDSIAGIDSIRLSGGASLTGTARTNGTLTLEGRSTVNGDAYAMAASVTGKSEIKGTLRQGAATLPSSLDLTAFRAWAEAHHDNARIADHLAGGTLALDGKTRLILPSGSYFLSGLKLSGGAELEMSGTVHIFLTGALDISGDGALNASGDANSLWIFSDHGQASIAGKGRAALHLYAPNADISITGSGQMAGRLLGKSVFLAGRASQPSMTALAPVEHRPGAAQKIRAPKPVAKASSAASSVKASALPALRFGDGSAFSLVHAGGSAVRSHLRHGVVIPEGALRAPSVAISVAKENAAAAELERRRAAMSARSLVEVGSPVSYGPEGTRFSKPVTLELAYERARLPANVSENQLAVHYWNPATGQWEALPSQVDAQAQIVRAQTDHFSTYQLLAGGKPSASSSGLSLGETYVFPNPARGGESPKFHIESSADAVDIRVFDVSGEVKYNVSIGNPPASLEHTWDISGVGSGVYSYVVTARKDGQGALRKTGKLAVIK